MRHSQSYYILDIIFFFFFISLAYWIKHVLRRPVSVILSPYSPGGSEAEGQIQFGNLALQQSHLAQIGISVEPLSQLAQQTPVTTTSETSIAPFVEFSTKMLESFFNYASSFAVQQAQMVPNPTETFVPFSTLQKWFENFQRRLQQNPYFWKS